MSRTRPDRPARPAGTATHDSKPGAEPAPPAPAGPAHHSRSTAGPASPAARVRAVLAHVGDYIARVYQKLADDNVFFLAGAIAFKAIVAIVPLILAALGVAGLLLQSRFGPTDAVGQVVRYILQALPDLDPELIARLRETLDQILEGATGYVGVGLLVLIWLATGLVGTLRTALREIFDLQEDRGIVAGKLYDMLMVVSAGTLLAINVGLSVVIQVVGRYGQRVLGLDPLRFQAFDGVLNVAAFVSIWFMFVLIYRYLPARRTQWRISMIAATFTGILFELMKAAFGWYVTNVASYTSTYGNFATLFIVLLWIYYMSVAFVIGGEVGQVAALRRTRKRQKERFS